MTDVTAEQSSKGLIRNFSDWSENLASSIRESKRAPAIAALTVLIILILLFLVWILWPMPAWEFGAPAFANPPTQAEVFEKCQLSDFGFTSQYFGLQPFVYSKTAFEKKMNELESNGGIASELQRRLEQNFPAIFKPGDSSLINLVTVSLPSSADQGSTIKILVEAKTATENIEPYAKAEIAIANSGKLKEYFDTAQSKIVNQLNAVLEVNPRADKRDLPLLFLIQAEKNSMGLGTFDTNKYANEPYLTQFKNNSYINDDGHSGGYEKSYALWLDALIALKTRQEKTVFAESWEQRLNNLQKLAGIYSEMTEAKMYKVTKEGEFFGFRVDGSVIVLAAYTFLVLELDSTEYQELNSIIGNFGAIKELLTKSMANLDPSLVTQNHSTSFAYTFSSPGSQLYGGRQLYYSMKALGDDDLVKQQSFMKIARESREHFKANHPGYLSKNVDSYLYCYLARTAVLNARICTEIEADNWATEWIDFLAELQGRCSDESAYSNYYQVLGDLSAFNTAKSGLKTGRWKQIVSGVEE